MPSLPMPVPYSDSRPWTRWWWFSGAINEKDITFQLDWLADNGFGGVEIAWVYPLPDSKPGPRWLSPEWTNLVTFAKRYAESIGLGCDFTFGTLWPFGGSFVSERDASRVLGGLSKQRLHWSWEMAHNSSPGYILNHLDRYALLRYSEKMAGALRPALEGGGSAIFCDSWEVETDYLWTDGFGERFNDRYGYRIEDYMHDLNKYPEIRYDYRKLIAEYILEEFYKPFTSIAHSLGAISRVQCHGAPSDLLACYGSADVPETEALLFQPHFARIAASAATLMSKVTVSCEAFTCIYGWVPRPGPAPYIKRERITDLKLLADSLFANGVNQIFWHGMPYNPEGGSNEFYASVHVGPDSEIADKFAPFNDYMRKVCSLMKRGRNYTDLAVYFPLEDAWMAGELPPGSYPPDARYCWEFRYLRFPEALSGRQPMWVSSSYLKNAVVENGKMIIGDARFFALYVDCQYLDEEALREIYRLAVEGLRIYMRRRPCQPGRVKTTTYDDTLQNLFSLENVISGEARIVNSQIVSGSDIPEFWCRFEDGVYYFFFAHPDTKEIRYPMVYGSGLGNRKREKKVRIKIGSEEIDVDLRFEPYQSILMKLEESGKIKIIDVSMDFVS